MLKLPPAFVYVAIALVCFLLFAPSWFTGEPEPDETRIAASSFESFDVYPQPVSEITDLFQTLSDQAGDEFRIGTLLAASIDKLESQVAAAVVGQLEVGLRRVSPEFTATGIDRTNFKFKFTDGQITVQRWQVSEVAPVFDGQRSFDRLASNVFKPWINSTDFRIEMKVHSRSLLDNLLEACLVVESSGRTTEKQGIQATAIWNTSWKLDDDQLLLESIQVQAQEEIAASFGEGKLLLDCTESIFVDCDTLTDQLAFGLDQWSRRIPNMDIMGNHGVAIGDVNGDGLDDLYLCQPHGLPNCLLIQNPDGTVKDVSKFSQLDFLDQSHAALMIDIDNDRDQDLVISTDENLLLMSNQGNGVFHMEHAMPIGRKAHSISAADFDQDGDLDLYLCKFQDVSRPSDLLMFPRQFNAADDGGRNILLRNDEAWIFLDVTNQCGLETRNRYWSRSAIWHDYDFDGDLDLYVANEFMNDQFFMNLGGRFSEISEQLGLTIASRHRSVSLGEFNQDGNLDFFVATDAPLSTFRELRTSGNTNSRPDLSSSIVDVLKGESQVWLTGAEGQKFVPFFLKAPIFSAESAYSSTAADLNNDGLDEVIVTNGVLTRFANFEVDELLVSNADALTPGTAGGLGGDEPPTEFRTDPTHDGGSYDRRESGDSDVSSSIARRAREVSDLVREGYSLGSHQRNRCFLSIGQLGFANFSALSGIDFPDDARAIAATDWDCDGDADIVMTCRGGPQIRILCNQLDSENDYVQFDLVGTRSNADAIGARVEVYLQGREEPLVKSLLAGSGNLSQSTKRLMFGLGKSPTIERVDVTWPTGETESFGMIVPNARYEVVEGNPEIKAKTNERTRLAIQPSVLEGDDSLPSAMRKCVFYPRPPIPSLQIQLQPNEWWTLQPVNQRPILAVFGKRDSDSEALLQRISDASSRLISGNVDCFAILVDTNSDDPLAQLRYARKIADRCNFPFPIGTLSESSRNKLKYLGGEWFNFQQPPNLPFGIWLDGEGRVVEYSSNNDLTADRFLDSIDRIGESQLWYRDLISPRGGRWAAGSRYANVSRLGNRLKDVGYLVDNEALRKKSHEQRAFELCQKAIELEASGDPKAAREYYAKSIEMDQNCVPALIGEAKLLRRLAMEDGRIEPELQIRMRNSAVAGFEKAIKLDPLNTEAIVGLANVAIDQNQVAKAVDLMIKFVQVHPTCYEIHAMLGRLLIREKRFDEAARYLTDAFEHRPSLPFVAGDLGFLYLRIGQFERSRQILTIANRLQPSDTNVLCWLADSEFFTGKFDEAIGSLQRVQQLEPGHRRSRNVLAWLFATSPDESQRSGEEAMKIIIPMLEQFGETSPSIMEIYAASLAENGKYDEAVRFQQQALDLVSEAQTTETYSDDQQQGLRFRLELYRRQQPYRCDNLKQTPIQLPGSNG